MADEGKPAEVSSKDATGVRCEATVDGPYIVVQYAPWDGSVECISQEYASREEANARMGELAEEYPQCKHRLFVAA